ncbi:unnamed protein product [Paramecium sonneborni]|uniref:Uncharacterized protein n=1 Tax=Paramecium sonneborni TaxID=65129 RepID=A0A8S1L1X1_9CILI|nr:unnamed protein product [Paramecium sonneborni]
MHFESIEAREFFKQSKYLSLKILNKLIKYKQQWNVLEQQIQKKKSEFKKLFKYKVQRN